MDVSEVDFEGVSWIKPVYDMVHWPVLMNMILNL
jgi:hypothetical protein